VILGSQQNQHREWISTETLSKIESWRKLKDTINSTKTRTASREAHRQFNKASQEVRKDIRRDQRRLLTIRQRKKQINTESTAKKHRMIDLYDLTKKLAGKKSCHQIPSRTNTVTHQPSRKTLIYLSAL